MQYAIPYDVVRRYNATAPALATVNAKGFPALTVEAYCDYYRTLNVRCLLNGTILDTQHNGSGWGVRRRDRRDPLSLLGPEAARAIDRAASIAASTLGLTIGNTMPGRKPWPQPE